MRLNATMIFDGVADHPPEILSAKITKRLPDYQSMVKYAHVLAYIRF
jgi:hypothetical protein